jgi:hypothetical protein
MRRAHSSTSLFHILVPSLLAQPLGPALAAARPEIPPFGISGHGLISQKHSVPDDPLAGLPTDDGGGRGKGGAGASSRTCALRANAANEQDIGDLRATLAFIKFGPRSLVCPARADKTGVRLRIKIDGTGMVTAVETLSGDPAMAAAIGKRLSGKSVAPRAEGTTVGVVMLTFAPGKRG